MKTIGLMMSVVFLVSCGHATYQQPDYYARLKVPAHLTPGQIYKVDNLRPKSFLVSETNGMVVRHYPNPSYFE